MKAGCGLHRPQSLPFISGVNLQSLRRSSLNSLDTIDSITFRCVHRLGSPKSKRPRPIIAKLEHYKHKDIIKSKARELKGSNFGINDQFPKEINDRRKILYLIMKQHRQNNKHSYMVVDKLYVDGQLYRNPHGFSEDVNSMKRWII
ncbi:hypothetical protein LDENG_00137740 [Lucifuga dentata]|nr:hypothetical protein LDENG_00137740 [Lucifuga dentata]